MQLTQLLHRLKAGDRGALGDMIPLVYEELKRMASGRLRSQRPGFQLQTTALVHETFLKLAGNQRASFENRSHFFAIAALMMRQVLVDEARSRTAQKRQGQEVAMVDLPELGSQPQRSLLALDEALQRLEKSDPLKGQLIEMLYFGGMTAEESAPVVSLSVATVRRELRLARAWLRKEMASRDCSQRSLTVAAL